MVDDFFKDMASSGILDLGNILHMKCLWFCFQPVIETELERVKVHWNTHRIRHSRQQATVTGIPDILFYLPEWSGASECKCVVQDQHIKEMEQKLQSEETDESQVYQTV